MNPYLSEAEAAAYWGVTVDRLRELTARHGLPYFRFGPRSRTRTYHRADLDAWRTKVIRNVPDLAPLPYADDDLDAEAEALGLQEPEK
jgi:excisionase family DNA binding protein